MRGPDVRQQIAAEQITAVVLLAESRQLAVAQLHRLQLREKRFTRLPRTRTLFVLHRPGSAMLSRRSFHRHGAGNPRSDCRHCQHETYPHQSDDSAQCVSWNDSIDRRYCAGAGSMLRMASMRHRPPLRIMTNDVHIFRAGADDAAPITYSPSAMATSAAGKRTVVMVMVRAPLFALDDARVPRTSSSRPRR